MADQEKYTSVSPTSPETMEKMLTGLSEPQKQMFRESMRIESEGAKEQAEKTIKAERGLLERQTEIGGAEKAFISEAQKGLVEPKAFEPTQENAKDLAALYSLVTVAGFFAGGKGRASANAALGNMAAAMDGYRKGRKDLFDREMKEFEKNLKATQEKNNFIKSKIENYLKLSSVDREKAMQEAKVLQAEAYGSKLQTDAQSGNIKSLLQTSVALTKINAQLDAALARISASANKLDSKTKSELRGNLATLGNISDLSNMIPNVADASIVFGILGGNVPENIQQYYSSPQAQQAISLLQNISSQILKLRSGATVTVAEFARQRGFLPQRSDSVETIQNKLRGLWDAISVETVGYGALNNQMSQVRDEIDSIPTPVAPSYRPSMSETKTKGTTATPSSTPKAKLNGRTIVVKDRKWVYEDTGKEVESD
ncbi:hypothetical protein EBZ39_09425 [bacterium]|nr:hypothetical protein [bacterium]